jgi:D-Tyr-tRNAtyr deacylase
MSGGGGGEELVGRWRLVSFAARAEDGSLAFPLGRNAEGSLLYTAEGWMAAQLSAGDRVSLTTEDPLRASEAERAGAFSSYLAYCGTYDVDADVITRARMAVELVNDGPVTIVLE